MCVGCSADHRLFAVSRWQIAEAVDGDRGLYESPRENVSSAWGGQPGSLETLLTGGPARWADGRRQIAIRRFSHIVDVVAASARPDARHAATLQRRRGSSCTQLPARTDVPAGR